MSASALELLRRDFPVIVELPVQWGDMDAFGHVNNVLFFRYFESARIAYFLRIAFTGPGIPGGGEGGAGPILHSTGCRFRRPLRYPDRLHVGARVTALSADRFTMDYALVSEQQGALAAEGTSVVVSFDYGRQAKAEIPAEVAARIGALEPGLAASRG